MSAIIKSDRDILRALAREIVAAAADPANDERREAHRRKVAREKCRPTVMICQEPWLELNGSGNLTLRCADEFCRALEQDMRCTLHKLRNWPGDMVINAASVQPYCIRDTGFGLEEVIKEIAPDSHVTSHRFEPQIKDEADIAKITPPVVTHDEKKTEESYQKRAEIFDGILKVSKAKVDTFWFTPWDQLVQWTGVQEVLADLAMRPSYVHKLVSRLVDCWIERLRQYEEQNLLSAPPGELNVRGAAQIFAAVSPAMHREFALEHEARFFTRFYGVYYGCCEPLHAKVEICAECMPNLRGLTMSPWVDFQQAVDNVRDRFAFLWKASPSFLANEQWSPGLVRKDMREKLAMAAARGCSVSIVLADISTVRNEPHRLTEWERIAVEEAHRVIA